MIAKIKKIFQKRGLLFCVAGLYFHLLRSAMVGRNMTEEHVGMLLDFPENFFENGYLNNRAVGICDGDYQYLVNKQTDLRSPKLPPSHVTYTRCQSRFIPDTDGLIFDFEYFDIGPNEYVVFTDEGRVQYWFSGSLSGIRFSFFSSYVDVGFVSYEQSEDTLGFSIKVSKGYDIHKDIEKFVLPYTCIKSSFINFMKRWNIN
ncbi:Oidioi.mRNA.OKI2018_I69.chr1.g5.t1.cds [Oikopleura dioica]|uniref:Oidioi.mRNA.OKI2018_I69.chr1.g5.t1.cds n=1 Tax=Oikopleura dioica TaxID=34765 RepID=A0ABN7SQR3_OIKDI|nr:Oidioi.mRNA.OKI2018_I69.chr1.g5.t1.cds [Oikopleura dioica]